MREMPAQTEQLIAHCACHLAHENFDKIALPRDGKYRVNCIGIEIVVEASSHFGAAFNSSCIAPEGTDDKQQVSYGVSVKWRYLRVFNENCIQRRKSLSTCYSDKDADIRSTRKQQKYL